MNQEKEFWAFLSPDGKILPTTIRWRAGDSGSALQASYPLSKRFALSDCILAQVKVSVVCEDPHFRYVNNRVSRVAPVDRFAGWEGDE